MSNASSSALQEEVETYHGDVKRLQRKINKDLKETTRLSELLEKTPLSHLETGHLIQVSDKIAALAGKYDPSMAKRYASEACC